MSSGAHAVTADEAGVVTRIDACRSCGSNELTEVLSLGSQPLANALRTPDEVGTPEARYPLDLVLCGSCSLVQLADSISPEVLFRDYPYFSSVIKSLVEHARELAQRLIAERSLGPDDLVMELASNDGYLLQHYRDAGVQVLGIDPARNIAEVAESRGIPTRSDFFGRELAEELVAEGFRPKLLHANNVLAHVPDLNGFVAGISIVLGDWGRAVIEAPYIRPLLEHCEFDTIYHEHLCYYSVTALDRLFRRHGLRLEDVEQIEIHGGSLRLFVAPESIAKPRPAVTALLEEERGWGVDTPQPYLDFAQRVERAGEELRALLGELKQDGAQIAAYGAAAKGSTLLNTFGIGAETLDFVADASEHKQGSFTPGTELPIVPPSRLLESKPDYVLLLAWNFAKEILEQQHEYREGGGRFIVPIPAPQVV